MQTSLRHSSQRLSQIPSASIQIPPSNAAPRKGCSTPPGVPTSQKLILALMVIVVMLTITNIFIMGPDSATYAQRDEALVAGLAQVPTPRQKEVDVELPKPIPIPTSLGEQHRTKQVKFWNEPDPEDPPGPLAESKFFSLVPFRHFHKADVSPLTSMPMISDFFNSSDGHKRLSLAVFMEKLSRQYFEWFTAQLVQPAGKQSSIKNTGRSGAVTDISLEQRLNCVVEWKVMRNRDPRMLQVTSLIHSSFAQDLIDIANRSLVRSTVVMDVDTSNQHENRSHDTVNQLRTSSGTFLTKWEDNVHPSNVALRVAVSYLLGVPEDFLEPTHILRYREGERYVPHLDYFDLEDKREMMNGGQRVATMITWLNAVHEGGETTFPAARLTIKPGNVGDGVVFYDVKSGSLVPDRTSVHSGEPPRNGSEKWIAVIWAHAQRYHNQ